MAFSILRLGSRGSDVKTLQEQLNAKLRPSPMLVTDGIFGGLTFQQMNWLVEDGEVGACTWNAATDGEAYQPILTISFIPPTDGHHLLGC